MSQAKLTLARNRRDVFLDSIASLEKLEEKEILLPADHVALQQLAKRIENLDAEFKNNTPLSKN